MPYKYATQITEQNARAVGTDLPISPKISREVCKNIQGKTVKRAKAILQGAIDIKQAIKYTKYNWNTGHRPGLGPARFPVKTAEHIMKIVDSATANARFKGMNAENLIVKSAVSQRGSITFRYGRQSRRKAKRAHIEIVLTESAVKKKERKSEAKKQ
jgi:large subunit ribosomal protein L22